MKINCIIIEDEPLAAKKIENFVAKVDYLNLMKVFDNAVDAIGYVKQHAIDLIFLDIRMKQLSGIQFLEAVQLESKVIVTTAYDEYALKGYELSVADYLLKPFTFERFLKSVDKIHQQFHASKSNITTDFIFVKTEYRMEKVLLSDILYIQGMKDYLQINTVNKKIMTLQTFKKLLEVLPSDNFQRVHNSYIVSISNIENIERNRIKMGEKLIPISDSYKDKFYAILKANGILI